MNEIEKAIEEMRFNAKGCYTRKSESEDIADRAFFEGKAGTWSEAAKYLEQAYAHHKSTAIPFSELAELAVQVGEKLDRYVSFGVTCTYFSSTKTQGTRYNFFGLDGTTYFNAAQALKAHMEAILSPPEDVGIILEGDNEKNGSG